MARSYFTPLADRFWEKVNKLGSLQPHMPTRCWEWTASTTPGGYGKIGSGSKKTAACHRLSYIWFYGPIPDGMQVQHLCDNRRCVRPEHLKLGFHKDNVHDAMVRNRWVTARGERQARAKLTDTGVIEARRLHAQGTTFAELARMHHMSDQAMTNAIRGKTWKHVPFPI